MLNRYPLLLLIFLLLSACSQNSIPMDVGDEVDQWVIENGQLVSSGEGNDALAIQYWRGVNNLLPDELLNKYVTSIRLYTDGPQSDLAGMNQIDESNTHWQIDLDTADVNFSSQDSVYILDYTHTIIHEYGHLLTLNATQVEPTEDEYQDDTKGYLTSEGYALKNSYLGKFVDQFWPIEFLTSWDKIDAVKGDKRRENLLFDFYLTHQERFVTDYSAQNPEEDIAESWAFFVLSDRPAATNVRSQKLQFFYQFSELVEARRQIRSKIKFIPSGYLERFQLQIEQLKP